ncbi:M35 family metallo-endopeptidase [Arenicella xantha]|uniref:Extracellular peptidase n=1 Tax=Arenicella xantha TaxID=644221 RepID=A0A395JL36_9GAMM|nr:M35 family metallo-endopeptidase [Arenicella xantha]RBP51482.1 extracellular peptidase [Arenicella xantha]
MLNLFRVIVRTRTATQVVCLSLLLCGVVSMSAAASLPAGIEVSLQTVQAKYGKDDAVMVKVTYRNVTSEAIKLLTWETALAGRVDEDFLRIVHEGSVVPYSGRHYKRYPPTDADYVTVYPGASVSATVDLSTGYSLSYKGDYLVSVKGGAVTSGSQKAPQVTIVLTSDRAIRFKQTPAFSGCFGDRPSQIDAALGSAERLARTASEDLRNNPVSVRGDARRYREWFGAYSESRWDRVQRNFDRIYSALSTRQITFICDDTSPFFAYVYINDPYKIYLGSVFWQVPQTGTDSKAGTIIHEVSHFTIVAGTDDVVYGQSGARSLANSNPNDAITNADSHEYFAENTPSLDMSTEPEPEPEPKPFIIQILQLLLFDD